jgi:hypothetical protein
MSTLRRESPTQGAPSIQLLMVAFHLVSSHILLSPSLTQPDPEDLKPKQFMGMEIPFSDGQNKDRFMAFFQVATVLDSPSPLMLPMVVFAVRCQSLCFGVCASAFVIQAWYFSERGIESILELQPYSVT